jgi:HK97 family phage major capsid protein
MLKYLKELLAKRKAKLTELQKRNQESESLDEVRSLGVEIAEVQEEVRGIEAQIAQLENENNNVESEQRAFNPNAALNVVATATQEQGTQRNEEEDPRGTMEYRTAFKNFIQRGEINRDVLQFEQRQDAVGEASNLGVLLPSTVIQKIIEGTEKKYGQIYSKVRKTNVPGGVKYPIGSFSATFHRITETGKSDRQNAGGVTGSVEFSYKIGEIILARTLLQAVLSVDAFETKFAEVIVKAYIEAMDKEVIVGNSANNECEGILSAAGIAKIPGNHIIEFTEDEISDWEAWEKKFFAEIPLSLEDIDAEFVMAKQTYVSNLCTMKDKNNQPINKAGFDSSDKQHKFNEYNVNRTEKDVFKDFDSCTNGEYFGMFWLPEEAYAINSNLEFTVMDYFDHDTNQYVKKALVINDGKILDPKYIFLFKKKVTA